MFKALKKKASLAAATILLILSLGFLADTVSCIIDSAAGNSTVSTCSDRPNQENTGL